MTTKAKIKQLEKKYNKATNKNSRPLVIRRITKDGRFVDESNYLMTKDEIKAMEKENEKIRNQNGLIIRLKTYRQPKKRYETKML